MAVRPLSDVFTARAIGLNWDNYKASLGEPPFLGRTKFGTAKQDTLTLEYIKGKNNMPVALKASNFDAQAELRDGIGFSTIKNEMPFFRESIMVTEKEEQDYASFVNSTNVAYANQILANIMKKPLDLIKGAQVVPERMIWQLLAPSDGVPKITYKVDSTALTIGYMASADETAYKQTNYYEITGTTDKWNAPATATPLADLINVKKNFAKNTGYELVRFSMNLETWEMLVDAEDTRKQVSGAIAYTNGIRLDDSQVVAYLRGKGIEIEVYNKMYIDETGATKYYLPTGYISCESSSVYLGTFTFGTTPEMRSGSLTDGNLSVVETGISVYTYTTNHPVNTHTVVSMLGLPTFEGIDSHVTMKVC